MKLYRFLQDDFPVNRIEFLISASDIVDAEAVVINYLINSKTYDIKYFLEDGIKKYLHEYRLEHSGVLADVSWSNDLKGHFDK